MKISIVFASFMVLFSCTASKSDLDAGLVIYFPFNQSISGTCLDSTDMQVISSRLTSDRFGNENSACLFNGEKTSIEIQFDSLPGMDEVKSVSWWYYAHARPHYAIELGAENMIVLVDSTAGIGIQFGFRAPGYGTNGFDTWEWGGGTILETAIPEFGIWHHCVYIHNGSGHRFYLDGLLAASSQKTLSCGSPNLIMFGNYPGGDQYFRGKLDEIRIYDRELSISEVKLLHVGGTAGKSDNTSDDPVRIILDADFGDDGDDLISLVMLHYFQDLGEAEILAVGQANTNRESPGAIDVINTYYNRPDILIGIARGSLHGSADQYSSFLIDHYPELTDLNLDSVPDAVDVYRRVLADAPDHSVNMVVIGFKRNMADLLKSGPDGYSDLNGNELVALKINKVYDMGGKYPYSNDLFNFGMDCEATAYYLEKWPTPMIFAGVRCGGIEVGDRVRNELTPVGRAMEEKLRYGWRHNETGQPGFDCAATLAAVRGVDTYFNTRSGCNVVFDCGTRPTMSFDYEVDCGHTHIDALNQKVSFDAIGDMIQDWVVAGPNGIR